MRITAIFKKTIQLVISIFCIILFFPSIVNASDFKKYDEYISWPSRISAYIWSGTFEEFWFDLPRKYEYAEEDEEDNEYYDDEYNEIDDGNNNNITSSIYNARTKIIKLDPDYLKEYGYHRWEIVSVRRSNKKVIFTKSSNSMTDNGKYLMTKVPSNFAAGHTPGKCTLTLKFKEYTLNPNTGKETYKIITKKSIVTIKQYTKLKVFGLLKSYNTRSNTFTMAVRNLSKKTITIYSKGAKSQDDDYTKFDRNLTLSNKKKYIKINPGQKKIIRFKVIGALTWPQVEDHNLISTWKYNGKKYKVKVDVGGTKIKVSKKWKRIDMNTYYNSDYKLYGID